MDKWRLYFCGVCRSFLIVLCVLFSIQLPLLQKCSSWFHCHQSCLPCHRFLCWLPPCLKLAQYLKSGIGSCNASLNILIFHQWQRPWDSCFSDLFSNSWEFTELPYNLTSPCHRFLCWLPPCLPPATRTEKLSASEAFAKIILLVPVQCLFISYSLIYLINKWLFNS